MAEFTGAHVEMGVALKAGSGEIFSPLWSETLAVNGSTGQVASGVGTPGDLAVKSTFVFRVRAPSTGPIYVARGKAPDASKAVSTNRDNTRVHIAAGESRDIPCEAGDKANVVSAA
jgi:hypothetical protein